MSRWCGVRVINVDRPGPASQVGVIEERSLQRARTAEIGPVVVPQVAGQPEPIVRKHHIR
jgi:hypothetical protein